MIDVPLYDSSNFIGAIPFFSATDSARKCTQIPFLDKCKSFFHKGMWYKGCHIDNGG
ncbi:hypothetical protein HMPREF9467_04015, partial [, partial [[Clostridium] clostridioforme 2_1_49FAA]